MELAKRLGKLFTIEASKLKVRILLGIAVSLICLFLAFKDISMSRLTQDLARANYALFSACMLLVMVIFAATAARWRLLFYPHHRPSFGRLFSCLMIAQLINTVLPVKLGPLARVYLIGRMEMVSKAFTLSTVLVEKVLEGLTLLLVLVLMLPFVPLPVWLRSSILWTGIISLTLSLVLLLLASQRRRAMGLADGVIRRFPLLDRLDLLRHIRSAIDGLDAWRERKRALYLGAWSMAIWAMIFLLNYVAMAALKIEAPLVAAGILLVVLQVGARIPSSPGNVGVFHYLTVLSLSLFSVDKETALSYGIALHLLIFLLPSLLGAFFLLRMNYDLQELQFAASDLNT